MSLAPAGGTPVGPAVDTAKLTENPTGRYVPTSYVDPAFFDESIPNNDGHLGDK